MARDAQHGGALELAPEAMETLAACLDLILPPREDGRLPGAGALGLAPQLAADAGARPEVAAVLGQGLAALGARAGGAAAFAGLSAKQRRASLDALAGEAPAFLPTLTFLAYAHYYRDPRVLEAIGHEPRPPHPRGYEMPPTDFGILDAVRGRDPFYRKP